MIRIGLIGTGNVAIALAREIRNHETLTLVQVIGRDKNKLPKAPKAHIPMLFVFLSNFSFELEIQFKISS